MAETKGKAPAKDAKPEAPKRASVFKNRTWLYHPRHGGKIFNPGDKHPGKPWTDDYKSLGK